MSDHTKLGKPSLWIPEADPIIIAALGKLAEECNELAGRISRLLIQGRLGIDPDDGRTNQEHLVEEMADVAALTMLARTLVPVNEKQYSERIFAKGAHKAEWLRMLAEHLKEAIHDKQNAEATQGTLSGLPGEARADQEPGNAQQGASGHEGEARSGGDQG